MRRIGETSSEELSKTAAAFAATVQISKDDVLDRQAWRRLADYGLLRMPLAGAPLCDIFAVLEGLAYGGMDEGLLFAVGAHLWTVLLPVRDHGTAAQRDHYLDGLSDGTLVGANASTEPDAGSDIFAMCTLATPDGQDYVLNGTKTLITNAPVADVFVVYATVDPGLGPMGITAFLVDAGTPGLARGRSLDKMGLHRAPMGELHLTDCRVPASSVLGRAGRATRLFADVMEHERAGLLAPSLGVMRRQLDACARYARTRQQAGQPIGRHQAVSHRIADMAVRLAAARALVYRAAHAHDGGRPATAEAAAAKLFVSDAYLRNALDAMRVHGGLGYLTETGIEADVRNAIGAMFYSGTADIQRNIIARTLNL
jgi:alkylation response protein AidB-like acyl-CoA dehydrogenase